MTEVKRYAAIPVSEKPFGIVFDQWPLDALPPQMRETPNGDLVDIDVVFEIDECPRGSVLLVSRRNGALAATSACLLADPPTLRKLSEMLAHAADALERRQPYNRCSFSTWEATVSVPKGTA